MSGPVLWETLTFTMLQLTLAIYGLYHFNNILSFCQAASSSGKYGITKGIMLVLVYLYAPIAAVSITFCWISYDLGWEAGYIFLFLPFLNVVLFFSAVLVTENDISNFVDTQREALARLPGQAPPPPLFVEDAPEGAQGEGGTAAIEMDTSGVPLSPPIPMKDEDAF